FAIEEQGFEPLHVSAIYLVTRSDDFTFGRDDFRVVPRFLGRDRARPSNLVYFRDDTAGMRFDHLCAIAEVNFVAVVVWWVVTGGDDDAGIRVQISNGERKFWC